MCGATFIDNGASKSLIPLPSSTHSDRDHACDATFNTDNNSKSLISVHSSMYSDVIMHAMQLSLLIVPVKVIFLYIP